MIGNDFTHYDLHSDNVMIYKPVNGGYIQYNYHFVDNHKVISFQSQYLVKIIDYGRCYFRTPNINSSDIYTMLCNNQQCNFNTTCGKTKGFKWLSDPMDIKEDYDYLNSSRKNISQDLRLLNYINQSLLLDTRNVESFLGQFDTLRGQLFYKLFTDVYYEKEFGAIEKTINNHPNHIVNINDALRRIIQLMKILPKNKYPKDRLIGTLNVYSDGRDMEYI